MITISCYTFHPLIQRFVRLYKRVQVVSDWLNCILSAFCCQCLPPLALSTSTSQTSPSIMDAKPTVDPERAGSGEPLRAQCVSIDFTPQPQDTDETAIRCNQFWELLKSQPDMEGMMVPAEKTPYANDEECVPVHKKGVPSRKISSKNTLPALKGATHSLHKGAASRHG